MGVRQWSGDRKPVALLWLHEMEIVKSTNTNRSSCHNNLPTLANEPLQTLGTRRRSWCSLETYTWTKNGEAYRTSNNSIILRMQLLSSVRILEFLSSQSPFHWYCKWYKGLGFLFLLLCFCVLSWCTVQFRVRWRKLHPDQRMRIFPVLVLPSYMTLEFFSILCICFHCRRVLSKEEDTHSFWIWITPTDHPR